MVSPPADIFFKPAFLGYQRRADYWRASTLDVWWIWL